MAGRIKRYNNNLSKIRGQLGKTQVEMADLLEISADIYPNYERGENFFPLVEAWKLAKNWGYTLQYIYALTDENEKIRDDFKIDIRDIVQIDANRNITICISESHFNYLLKKSEILASSFKNEYGKNQSILELDHNFLYNKNQIVAEFKINHDDFETYVKSEDIKIPFCEGSTISSVKIMENSEEKNKKVKKMFDDIINNKSE